jgi:hypothetical protein
MISVRGDGAGSVGCGVSIGVSGSGAAGVGPVGFRLQASDAAITVIQA